MGNTAKGNFEQRRKTGKRSRPAGLGQLSLVEHALCPLDTQTSLVEGLVHRSEFTYHDRNRHQRTGEVVVRAMLGLSPVDELFLWGMLGLTFAQADPIPELWATPHFILNQLGMFGTEKKRGGRNYTQFRESLRRLAALHYESNAFYDPIRAEHRRVAFGFLSFSLPQDDSSSRAWRIAWDPVFFEFCQVTGGRLFFDMELYRTLDSTARRLFLFLSKIFWRRKVTGWIDLGHVGYEILGIAKTVALRDLKAKKVKRPMQSLIDVGVLATDGGNDCFRKVRTGHYQVRFTRGPYFERRRSSTPIRSEHSAEWDLLERIELTEANIRFVLRTYSSKLIREWADITLAAQERFGKKYFRKGSAAYYLDNLKHASQGNRTPPDWWHELRKQEREPTPATARKSSSQTKTNPSAEIRQLLAEDAQGTYATIARDTFNSLVSSGKSPAEAQRTTVQVLASHLERKVKRM